MAQQPGGHEPVYLTLADVLELFAAIVDGTPVDAAKPVAQPRGARGRARTAGNPRPLPRRRPRPPSRGPRPRIAETQPFIDGNKRAALVAMLTFLEINGIRLQAADPELAAWVIDLSAGSTPEELADKIRRAAHPAT